MFKKTTLLFTFILGGAAVFAGPFDHGKNLTWQEVTPGAKFSCPSGSEADPLILYRVEGRMRFIITTDEFAKSRQYVFCGLDNSYGPVAIAAFNDEITKKEVKAHPQALCNMLTYDFVGAYGGAKSMRAISTCLDGLNKDLLLQQAANGAFASNNEVSLNEIIKIYDGDKKIPAAKNALCVYINPQTMKQEPSFFRLIKDRTSETLSVLLNLCADTNLNYRNREGRTILHQMAIKGDDASMKLLLDKKAKADVKDIMGRTAFHYTEGAQAQLMLINAGARADAVDNEGKKPRLAKGTIEYLESLKKAEEEKMKAAIQDAIKESPKADLNKAL